MPKATRKGESERIDNVERRRATSQYDIERGLELPEKVKRAFRRYGGQREVRRKFLEQAENVARETAEKNAARLLETGAVVITVLTPELFEVAYEVMQAEMESYPEFREGATRLVSGSFGGYGNPTSFHSPMTRILREMALVAVKPMFRAYSVKKGYKLEECFLQQLFDRIVRRTEGDSIPSEQWHRDTSAARARVPKERCPPYSNKESEIREKEEIRSEVGHLFGGWINLNGSNQAQYFSCFEGSHSDATEGTGFDKLTKEDIEHLRSRLQQCAVRILPGQLMLFRQNLVHEVRAYKVGPKEFRQHIAFNLSTSGNRMMFGRDHLTRTIERQRAAILPSGQLPPMYSANDLSFRTNALAEWSQKTLKTQFLHEAEFGKTSKQSGEKYTKCYRFIMELERPFWPRYEQHDVRAMEPIALL